MQVAVQVDNGFLSPDFYFEMIVTLESPDLTGFVKDEGVDYTKCFDDRGTPSIATGTRVCTGQLQNQLVEECVLYGGIALWTLYKYIHTHLSLSLSLSLSVTITTTTTSIESAAGCVIQSWAERCAPTASKPATSTSMAATAFTAALARKLCGFLCCCCCVTFFCCCLMC
jgi:hypothetical protein